MNKDYFVSPPNTGCLDFSVALIGACRETVLRWLLAVPPLWLPASLPRLQPIEVEAVSPVVLSRGDDFVSIFSEQDSCIGLSHGHLASGGAVNFAGDVASLTAGQENENGGDLSGLGSAPEDGLRAELFHLLLGQCRRDKWSPDRAWSYGVDPHTLLDRKTGKRPSEADDGRFRRSVGDEIRTRIERLD
jgi:hypothetical protein